MHRRFGLPPAYKRRRWFRSSPYFVVAFVYRWDDDGPVVLAQANGLPYAVDFEVCLLLLQSARPVTLDLAKCDLLGNFGEAVAPTVQHRRSTGSAGWRGTWCCIVYLLGLEWAPMMKMKSFTKVHVTLSALMQEAGRVGTVGHDIPTCWQMAII